MSTATQHLRRLRHQPMSTLYRPSHVGVLVFMEYHRRILKGEFGEIPKPISDDAFNMGGYCLDAPELMPAGSTEFYQFGPEKDDWIAEPTSIEREPML